ncbi:hypothetical protein [Streptomyces sp. NPDC003090]|uniref:SCO2195 family GlnR-regulated protein n=1 Tax=Streptomyces sp. NPDC003090 TaxID=3154274 RepID=UPI0037F43C4C
MRTPRQQVRTPALPASPGPARPPLTPLPSVTGALRVVEALLLGGGQRTARRNAWTSVLEDRRRARARVEAQHVLEAAASRSPSDT